MIYVEFFKKIKIYLIDAIAVLSGVLQFFMCKVRTCRYNLSSDLNSTAFCNMQLRTARTIKGI